LQEAVLQQAGCERIFAAKASRAERLVNPISLPVETGPYDDGIVVGHHLFRISLAAPVHLQVNEARSWVTLSFASQRLLRRPSSH
jgi:hypothetical protein